MESPAPSTLVIRNTFVRDQSRDMEVGRNAGLSNDSSVEEIDARLGNEDRNTPVSLEDIDTSKDDFFEMDEETYEKLRRDLEDTFSPDKQERISEDVVTSIKELERESLLKKLSEIQNELTNWQLSRLVEVLGNVKTQGPTSDIDRTLQSAGKYIDEGAAKKRKKRYRKIDPSIKKKLDEYFDDDDTPSKRGYERIALNLGLTVKHVRTWFKNERSKKKRAKGKLEKELCQITGVLND